MKTLAHVSELRFGREDPAVVEGLAAELTALRPDLVVVSGDLLLAGHLHLGSVSDLRTAREGGHDVIVAQAGTAVSVRRRHQPNSYNVVTLDGDRLVIAVRVWDGGRVAPRDEARFLRGADGWRRAQPETGVQISTSSPSGQRT